MLQRFSSEFFPSILFHDNYIKLSFFEIWQLQTFPDAQTRGSSSCFFSFHLWIEKNFWISHSCFVKCQLWRFIDLLRLFCIHGYFLKPMILMQIFKSCCSLGMSAWTTRKRIKTLWCFLKRPGALKDAIVVTKTHFVEDLNIFRWFSYKPCGSLLWKKLDLQPLRYLSCYRVDNETHNTELILRILWLITPNIWDSMAMHAYFKYLIIMFLLLNLQFSACIEKVPVWTIRHS